MAISTAGTYLMYSTDSGTTYEKLVDIKDYPDLGSTPEQIDTTDLSALKYKTNIFGLQEIPQLEFECNYDKDTFDTIEGLTGSQFLAVYFTLDGSEGIFKWEGEVSIYATGGAVGEARMMTVTCSAGTPIVKS